MSAHNAAAAALDTLDRMQLPPEGLRGRYLVVLKFRDEDTCRRHYPHRALGFHQQMVTTWRKEARKRGGRMVSRIVDQGDTVPHPSAYPLVAETPPAGAV